MLLNLLLRKVKSDVHLTKGGSLLVVTHGTAPTTIPGVLNFRTASLVVLTPLLTLCYRIPDVFAGHLGAPCLR